MDVPKEARTPEQEAQARRERLRLAATAAAVLAVWALLLAAPFASRPLFLGRPPITRRAGGSFYEFPAAAGGRCDAGTLAQGAWTDAFLSVRCTNASGAEFGSCADTPQRHWRFSEAARACGARRRPPGEARALLAGLRLVFAGDSIARNLYGAALRLLGEKGQEVVVGHADFAHSLPGDIRLQFFWAPFPGNLTAVLGRLLAEEEAGGGGDGGEQAEQAEEEEQQQQADEQQQQQPVTQQQEQEQQKQRPARRRRRLGQQPRRQQAAAETADAPAAEEEEAAAASGAAAAPGPLHGVRRPGQPALVMLSTVLWHLLHFTAADDFGQQLGQLKDAAADYAAAATAATAAWQAEAGKAAGAAAGAAAAGAAVPPRLVLASGTETFPNRMLTAAKKARMTPENLDAYNQALQQVGLLAPGGGPFSVLDLFPLTLQCGEECSTDGVHSLPAVYDVALQIMLNVAAAQAP